MMSSQSLNAVMLCRSIWVKLQLTFFANLGEIDTNLVVSLKIKFKNFLSALIWTRMLPVLTRFLMLNGFFITES